MSLVSSTRSLLTSSLWNLRRAPWPPPSRSCRANSCLRTCLEEALEPRVSSTPRSRGSSGPACLEVGVGVGRGVVRGVVGREVVGSRSGSRRRVERSSFIPRVRESVGEVEKEELYGEGERRRWHTPLPGGKHHTQLVDQDMRHKQNCF